MAKDMFGAESRIAGAWHIDEAVLTIEGGQDLVATGFRMQYGRTVMPYQPINRAGKFLISGPGSGRIDLSAVIGPSKAIKTFLERYADICQAASNTILVRPAGIENCDETSGEDPLELLASGCVLTTASFSVDNLGGLSVVTSGLSIMVNGLELK